MPSRTGGTDDSTERRTRCSEPCFHLGRRPADKVLVASSPLI
jgi:hypothetical protein